MRVGAIDNPDLFEDVFELYCVQEVIEIFFTRQISKIRSHKLSKKGFFEFGKLFMHKTFIKPLPKAKKTFLG